MNWSFIFQSFVMELWAGCLNVDLPDYTGKGIGKLYYIRM